jgi:hypothetical protein
MNRTQWRNAITIGGICFVLGLVVMRWFVGLFETRSASPTGIPAAQSDNYQTYALLFVDQFSSPQPQVDGVWLAWVPNDYSTAELVGVPPTQFQHEYSHDIKGVPTFSLQAYLRGPLGGTFVLDRADMLELADQIGGVQVEGVRLQGEPLLNYYLDPELEMDEALIRQGAVMQGLIAQVAIRGTTINYETLLGLPSLTTVSHDPLYELVRHYYPLHTDQIQVRALLSSTP